MFKPVSPTIILKCILNSFRANAGDGKYPIFRVFANNTVLCRIKRHTETSSWITNILEIVRHGSCHLPDYAHVHGGGGVDQSWSKTRNRKKERAKGQARKSRMGEDLGMVPDEDEL